jgi:3-oxoacyl-[acyl-carrier-protein] synthase-3
MALFSIPGVLISGIAAAIPKNKVNNLDLDLFNATEKQAFIRTVGIESRRVAPAGLCTSDLCVAAARQLLRATSVSPATIGALVFVTQTPDYLLPGNSMLVQQRLGMLNSSLLLDLNQGCAGYVYGLSALASLMHTAGIDRGLLLVGDTITHLLSPQDRATVPIFSDAGTATLLERAPTGKSMFFHLGADGTGAGVIQVKGGGARHPNGPQSRLTEKEADAIQSLSMQGVDVLHYTLSQVPANVRGLLDYVGPAFGGPDYFVFHQANRLLNESLLKKLKIPVEKAPETLSEFGNTSSATIPITICHRLGKQLAEATSNILLSGFGVGFSWGSALIEMGPIICPPVLEIDIDHE